MILIAGAIFGLSRKFQMAIWGHHKMNFQGYSIDMLINFNSIHKQDINKKKLDIVDPDSPINKNIYQKF